MDVLGLVVGALLGTLVMTDVMETAQAARITRIDVHDPPYQRVTDSGLIQPLGSRVAMRWKGESLDEPDHLGDRRGVLSSRVRSNVPTSILEAFERHPADSTSWWRRIAS